jgi:hypothetical protein
MTISYNDKIICNLQIPIVEKRALDLFTLKKYVLKAGGMEKVNAEKKWAAVAVDIGYNPLNSVKIGALLKSHYERILYPLDVFEKEEASKMREEKELKAKASQNCFSNWFLNRDAPVTGRIIQPFSISGRPSLQTSKCFRLNFKKATFLTFCFFVYLKF